MPVQITVSLPHPLLSNGPVRIIEDGLRVWTPVLDVADQDGDPHSSVWCPLAPDVETVIGLDQ